MTTDYEKALENARKSLKERSENLQKLFDEQLKEAVHNLDMVKIYAGKMDTKSALASIEGTRECLNNCSVMLRIKNPGPEAIRWAKEQVLISMQNKKDKEGI